MRLSCFIHIGPQLVWATLAALCHTASMAQPTTANIRLEEPRGYGYVVGDLVQRRATIALDPGRTIATTSLPRPGRLNTWLELRRIDAKPVREGVELDVVYQIVNAPEKVITIVLPAIALKTAGDTGPGVEGEVIEISAWPITVSPLTPDFVLARAGLEAMQPDVMPQPEPLRPIALRLALWVLLLTIVGYLLAARRDPRLAFWRRNAPFRDALADLHRLARRGSSATTDLEREALARLHHAFNASAGCALFADRLSPLYAARPGLRELAPQVQAFYAESRRVFFSSQPSGPPIDAAPRVDLPALIALCRRLAQQESRP